jgi:hypothetical protein
MPAALPVAGASPSSQWMQARGTADFMMCRALAALVPAERWKLARIHAR